MIFLSYRNEIELPAKDESTPLIKTLSGGPGL
jgi:hypothetical protein